MANVGNARDEWLMLLQSNESNTYTTFRRQDISEESFRALLNNGDAVLIHALLSYVLDGLNDTAHAFRFIVPQLNGYTRRALRECAFDYGPFAVQRLRFAIFEYFARMATRQLVAEALSTATDWHYHVSVYNLENRIMGDWYEWFEETGLFIGGTVGFLAETKQHYRKLRDLVQQWKNDNQ